MSTTVFSATFRESYDFVRSPALRPMRFDRPPARLTHIPRLERQGFRPRHRLDQRRLLKTQQHLQARAVVGQGQGNAVVLRDRRHQAKPETVATRPTAFVQPEEPPEYLLPR